MAALQNFLNFKISQHGDAISDSKYCVCIMHVCVCVFIEKPGLRCVCVAYVYRSLWAKKRHRKEQTKQTTQQQTTKNKPNTTIITPPASHKNQAKSEPCRLSKKCVYAYVCLLKKKRAQKLGRELKIE